jgi:hypothetical protein
MTSNNTNIVKTALNTTLKDKYKTYETKFDNFISGVKMFFCWNYTIKYPYPNSDAKICYYSLEIPILQCAICLIQIVISFYPDTVWGPKGVFIFNTVIIGFLTLYLALRFSWITEKHKEITECDTFVIQTVVFVITINYVYNEFLKIPY